MPPHSLLNHRQSFSPSIRYPALFLTYGFLNPLLWLVDQAGYSERCWRMIGRNLREKVSGGRDFGDYQATAHDVIVCTYPKANVVNRPKVAINSRGR